MTLCMRIHLLVPLRQKSLMLRQPCRKWLIPGNMHSALRSHTKGSVGLGLVVGVSAVGTCVGMAMARCHMAPAFAQTEAITALASRDPAADTTPAIKCKQITVKKEETTFLGRIIRRILLCVRFVRLSMTFGPLLMLYPLCLVSSRIHRLWLKMLFKAVENAGPVFIKLGQWASTRRDLFSSEFCDQFSRLHHHVRPHSWKFTEQALVAAYGKPSKWKKVLKVDKTPLGSGCVAQVYKGYVHTSILSEEVVEALDDSDDVDDLSHLYYLDGVPVELPSPADPSDGDQTADSGGSGQSDGGSDDHSQYADMPDFIPVAIKVLHPNVRRNFSRDLTLMKIMARVLEKVIPSLRWVNLTQCVQEFSVAMMKQTDMVHEAKCLQRFHRDFADISKVRIPVPIRSLVNRNILVESFEDGQPISDFLSDSGDFPDGLKEKLADIGVDALLQMVFVNNFVHADLHPGNILVQNAQSFKTEPETTTVMVDVGDTMVMVVAPVESPVKLVLLDCGITASLGPSDRDKFRQVFTAVVKGEGEAVANLFLEKSEHVECKDPDAFRREMAAIVSSARATALQLSKIKVSALLSDVFSVLSRHHVKLESNFANIILAIAVLEGLGRSLDPQLDILSKARGVLLF